jgi:hypothetical protein
MKKHFYPAILIMLGFSLIASACAILPAQNEVAPTSHPGWIFFQDDFSVSPNGWGTMGQEGGEASFNYEGMVIKVYAPNSLFWTVNEGKYADTKIDIDAVLLDGPSNDNFGVICRFVDNDNFYGFLITHDGYYGIFKMLDGQMILSGNKSNLDFSEAIRQGGIVNHITATCNGDILELSVNDVTLAEIQDISFKSGQIGLLAGAYDSGGVQVLFDNLIVTQP